MKKSIGSKFLLFVLLMVLVISGCVPASTPAPSTPLPTNTSVPTNTPVPTKTPIPPTATVPAPEKPLEYLNGVKVVRLNTFDDPLSTAKWYFNAGTHTTHGVLEIFGKDWNAFSSRQRLDEGEGVIMDFNYSKGCIFEAYMIHGATTDSADYKTVGIYFEKNRVQVNVWAAKNSLGGAFPSGNLSLQPDTDYSLLMAVIPNGEFLVVIWEPSDSSKVIYYHEKIGKNWSNLTWDSGVAVDHGIVLIDNYIDIEFDSMKQ